MHIEPHFLAFRELSETDVAEVLWVKLDWLFKQFSEGDLAFVKERVCPQVNDLNADHGADKVVREGHNHSLRLENSRVSHHSGRLGPLLLSLKALVVEELRIPIVRSLCEVPALLAAFLVGKPRFQRDFANADGEHVYLGFVLLFELFYTDLRLDLELEDWDGLLMLVEVGGWIEAVILENAGCCLITRR